MSEIKHCPFRLNTFLQHNNKQKHFHTVVLLLNMLFKILT